LEQLPIAFPKKEEEQKIADCLTSLDELIAAQGRKVEALKAHKKGLMQQLFPREGGTLPRLRFPEFRYAQEWEAKRLDDLAKRGTGHTPKKAIAEYYDGGIKWISLADSQRLDKGIISKTAIEVSEQGIANSSAVLHPPGTVVLSRDAGVGKSGIMGLPMAVSQHFIVWTCDHERLSNWFLYYVLQLLKPLFERIATGSTIKTIGVPFFAAMSITVPSFGEQQRIADCLSALDARIAAESDKLAALKTHKKGLMQQLFPAPEAD
jgi:type I restriction enzyme S subunit